MTEEDRLRQLIADSLVRERTDQEEIDRLSEEYDELATVAYETAIKLTNDNINLSHELALAWEEIDRYESGHHN